MPPDEDVDTEASFRSGITTKKTILLTGEKILEFKKGLLAESYQVIDRDKVVSTDLDYTFPKKPFILGLALFAAGINIDRISLVESRYPLTSAALSMFGGLSIIYGLAKIRKRHMVNTSNPEVRMSLPRRGKSTEILNRITEKL